MILFKGIGEIFAIKCRTPRRAVRLPPGRPVCFILTCQQESASACIIYVLSCLLHNIKPAKRLRPRISGERLSAVLRQDRPGIEAAQQEGEGEPQQRQIGPAQREE